MNIPTTALELSKLLGTDPYNLRRGLAAANGQINYNRETDELTPEQLAIWLPRYLQGKGQFKGDKRATVEQLLRQLEANGTTTEIPTEKPIQYNETQQTRPTERQPKNNGIIKQLQSENDRLLALLQSSTNELANENDELRRQIKVDAIERARKQKIKDAIFLVVSINGVFWQSMHFASLEVSQSLVGGFLKDVSPFGIGIGFEAMALLLTIFSDKETRATWFWLFGFGLVAFCMNLIYYNAENAVGLSQWFKVGVLSFALPFSIVAGAHLYISNKSK